MYLSSPYHYIDNVRHCGFFTSKCTTKSKLTPDITQTLVWDPNIMLCKSLEPYKHPTRNKLIYHERNFRTPATASKQIGDLPAEDPHLKPQDVLIVHELKHAPISNLQLVVDCEVLPSTIETPYGTIPQVPHLPVLVSIGEDNRDVSSRKRWVKGCWNCLFDKIHDTNCVMNLYTWTFHKFLTEHGTRIMSLSWRCSQSLMYGKIDTRLKYGLLKWFIKY